MELPKATASSYPPDASRYAQARIYAGEVPVFALGVLSVDFTPHNSFGNNPAGASAYAAAAVNVSGGGALIPMSFNIHGSFLGEVSNGSAAVELSVVDFQGRSLGVAVISRNPLTGATLRHTTWANPYLQDEWERVTVEGVYRNATLDFQFPNVPGNGLFVRLASSANMVFDPVPSVGVNFSNSAVLNVNPPEGVSVQLASGQTFQHREVVPVVEIYQQPRDAIFTAGEELSLNVGADSRATMDFQWFHEGSELPGEIGPALRISAAEPTHSGSYQVRVTADGSELFSEEVMVTVYPDQDGDQLPDPWEVDHGLNPEVANDPGSNADGDRLTDHEEYLVGTDPSDPRSFLKVESIRVHGEFVEIEMMAAAYRRYSAQWSARPDSGNWRRFADILPSPEDRTVTVTADLVKGVPRFFRIEGEGVN